MNTLTKHARAAALAGALCAALLPAGAAAPGQALTIGNVDVSYRDPAHFTEIRRNPAERTDWLDALSRHTAQRAARVLPAGEHLAITITDVLRAGMFEPWRRGNLANARIVRNTTPPRIALSFRLESAQGAMLKQGERQLHDVAFLRRSSRYQGDPLAYEKNLIDAWLDREIRSTPR